MFFGLCSPSFYAVLLNQKNSDEMADRIYTLTRYRI